MQKTDIPNFLRRCHNLTKKNLYEENKDIAKSCENSIYITNAEFNSCKLWSCTNPTKKSSISKSSMTKILSRRLQQRKDRGMYKIVSRFKVFY